MSDSITFVIGPPRSGTTLLKDLLATHPELDVHGEDFHLFHHDLSLFPQRTTSTEHYYLTGAAATDRIRADYTEAIKQCLGRSGRQHFVCKISTLSIQVDYLRRLLPQARFIQLVRDGRDTMLSMEDLRQGLGGDERVLGPAADPVGLAFAEAFPQAPAVLRGAASWFFHVVQSSIDLRFAGPSYYTRLRYEDLVAEPRDILAGCFDFIGVGWPSSPAGQRDVTQLLEGVSDDPGRAGRHPPGFSTSQASGPRLQRFKRDLSVEARLLAAPLLHLPMLLLGYPADAWPYADDFAAACDAHGIDFDRLRQFVKDLDRWGSAQQQCFSAEAGLAAKIHRLNDDSRPLLIAGAQIGWQALAPNPGIGAGETAWASVAKQERRHRFADAAGCWAQVGPCLDGQHRWGELRSLCPGQSVFESMAASIEELCRLGYCGLES